MSRRDCERWASIVDREALEIELSHEEAQFQVEHAQLCQACAAELAAWGELQALEMRPTPSDRDLLLKDAVLDKLWNEPRSPQRRAKARRFWAIGAAACTIAAAAAALLVVSSRRSGSDTLDVARVVVGSGDSLTAQSTPRRIGELVGQGETLRAGASTACLLIEPGVRACLSAGGELRIANTAIAHRRLELVRGRIVASLSPQPAGTSFSISTPGAVVTAVGTIFSVELAEDGGKAKVRVLRGSVKVRASGAGERVLGAHQELAFGVEAPASVAAGEEARDLALLRDDSELAAAAAELPSRASAPGEADVAAASPASPSKASASSDSAASASAEPTSPGDLLRRALALRAAGRFGDAANVYRKLVAQQPRSPEARTALVSLGDLQLSRLSDASAALRSFDAYLAGGDRALAQEAQYGRIRALRALGRSSEEQRAIEQLLSSYPAGVHAEPMRARLQTLKGNAGR